MGPLSHREHGHPVTCILESNCALCLFLHRSTPFLHSLTTHDQAPFQRLLLLIRQAPRGLGFQHSVWGKTDLYAHIIILFSFIIIIYIHAHTHTFSIKKERLLKYGFAFTKKSMQARKDWEGVAASFLVVAELMVALLFIEEVALKYRERHRSTGLKPRARLPFQITPSSLLWLLSGRSYLLLLHSRKFPTTLGIL